MLVILRRPDQVGTLLDAAQCLPANRVRALTIRHPPEADFLPSEEVAARTRPEPADWPDQIDVLLRTRPGIDCVQSNGSASSVIPVQARDAGFIVMARPDPNGPWHAHDDVHAALFEADRPVLLVSDKPSAASSPPAGRFGRVVGIAWQDDGRAEKAVRASLPLLQRATQIHVLRIGSDAPQPALLRQLNIDATYHIFDEPGPTAQALLHAAHHLGVDLLVMGAFAHHEGLERILGGVTQTMLTEADMTLLLRH